MNPLLTSPAHLIAALTLVGTLGSPAAAADEPDDLLRFANGDVIHGHFVGVENGPRLMWQRDDLPSPVGFDASKLRQLVFNAGKPTHALASPSNAVMVNGDLLPGRILKLTDTALTLETEFAGTLEIPRTAVAQINPNPHGGQLHYSGPFNTDGWTMPADPSAKDAPALENEDMPRDPFAPARPQRTANQPQKGDPWLFSGAAFYSNGTLPLLRDVHMPDRARLRFEIAWRSRLNLTIGFHADMKVPAKAAEPQQPQFRGQQNYPYIFGNSYVLTIYSSYAQLWRSGFDEAGNPLSPERIQVGNTSLNLPESGSAVLELRCDRKAKTIALYINDEFALQWDEADTPYAGKGSGIGFICPAGSNQVRISEVLVASWNGMSDSARSMESADADVVLLVNGTDRFAGNIRQIDNAEVTLTGTYAEMRIPLTEVAEIHFAKDRRMAVAEPSAKNATVKFFPLGRVTGQLITSKDGNLTMDSPILGKLAVNLRYPIMFDFSNTSSFIDDWNVGF